METRLRDRAATRSGLDHGACSGTRSSPIGHQDAETGLGSGDERWAVRPGRSGARRCWAPGLDGLGPAAGGRGLAVADRPNFFAAKNVRILRTLAAINNMAGQNALGGHAMDPAAARLVRGL